VHQQGLSGFKYILENRNKKVTELTDARRNAILNNLPTDLKNKIVWTYE
jgi:hypothetical protein